jgi:AbiJ N-terminal domain 4
MGSDFRLTRSTRRRKRTVRNLRMSSFSTRHGFQPPDADITIRHEAPEEFRGVLVTLAYDSGLSPADVRSVVCRILHRREDPNNWSPFPYIDNETRGHLDDCEWYEVYDVSEAL